MIFVWTGLAILIPCMAWQIARLKRELRKARLVPGDGTVVKLIRWVQITKGGHISISCFDHGTVVRVAADFGGVSRNSSETSLDMESAAKTVAKRMGIFV